MSPFFISLCWLRILWFISPSVLFYNILFFSDLCLWVVGSTLKYLIFIVSLIIIIFSPILILSALLLSLSHIFSITIRVFFEGVSIWVYLTLIIFRPIYNGELKVITIKFEHFVHCKYLVEHRDGEYLIIIVISLLKLNY